MPQNPVIIELPREQWIQVASDTSGYIFSQRPVSIVVQTARVIGGPPPTDNTDAWPMEQIISPGVGYDIYLQSMNMDGVVSVLYSNAINPAINTDEFGEVNTRLNSERIVSALSCIESEIVKTNTILAELADIDIEDLE